MAKLSLDSGIFASNWKLALVLPLLKPAKEDVDYKYFRAVSNLRFVSKLTEKVAAAQLIDHMPVPLHDNTGEFLHRGRTPQWSSPINFSGAVV